MVGIKWRRYAINTQADSRPTVFDIVNASYVLSEFKTDKERSLVLDNLWASTAPNGILVLVEPGTPIGFGIIRQARAQLLQSNSANFKSKIIGPVKYFLFLFFFFLSCFYSLFATKSVPMDWSVQ
jgi:ribosomal protein RSM22 (predicted rRNA methylase)